MGDSHGGTVEVAASKLDAATGSFQPWPKPRMKQNDVLLIPEVCMILTSLEVVRANTWVGFVFNMLMSFKTDVQHRLNWSSFVC